VTVQRKALIVASDKYEQEALRNLLAPEADAEALRRVLSDPQIGDFVVQVVRNEPAYVIQEQIEKLFSEGRPDDLLLLHFSGHGLKSESGELFFAASNTRPDRIRATAVPADFVQQCMQHARSRSVVLLDCCYGGAFAKGVTVRAAGDVNVLDSFPRGRLGIGRGRAVITASNAMEYAFEGDRLADDQHRYPSVFTAALVEGLATGDADRDEDGWVSLDELYDYVFDKVREQNPHQTPSRRVELEGELYLARSRRRRIRPAPIPSDLHAAITDPNIFARRGAVSELQSRLASEDLPVAVGAYEALTEIARTDIQYIAGLAVAAMAQAAIRPEETELHFGRAEQGSPMPHQVVRLLGPPIARACVPRPSHDWIRLDQVAEGLEVSVDTTGAGTLRGSVDLKGPTGEAMIAIEAEIISPLHESDSDRLSSIDHQKVPDTGTPQSEASHHDDPIPATPSSASLTDPSTRQPPIRRGVAFAGAGAALLAGIVWFISACLTDTKGESHVYLFFAQASNVVPIVAALTALLRINWLRVLGFLQGMYWPIVAWLPANIVYASVDHMSGDTGRVLAGVFVGIIGDVMGVCGAILLVISWNQAVVRPRAWQFRTLPVMLVCGIGLSQVAQFIYYYIDYYSATDTALYSAAILVGLALAWYATSLRATMLGGALMLGWVAVTALSLIADMTISSWSASTIGYLSAVFSCVLLAIVVILAIIYMREPAEPDPDPVATALRRTWRLSNSQGR
jgi:hypothetical protein